MRRHLHSFMLEARKWGGWIGACRCGAIRYFEEREG